MSKLQLKKITCATLLFLSGCMMAPTETFTEQLQSQNHYDIPFGQLETVLVNKHYDSAHHIGSQLPISPEQAIVNWSNDSFRPNILLNGTLRIVVHQADMTQKFDVSPCCASKDKETDTLDYDIEVVVLTDNTVTDRFPVQGQAYVTFDRSMTLSKKESERGKLMQKMLNHLSETITTNIDHVVEI